MFLSFDRHLMNYCCCHLIRSTFSQTVNSLFPIAYQIVLMLVSDARSIIYSHEVFLNWTEWRSNTPGAVLDWWLVNMKVLGHKSLFIFIFPSVPPSIHPSVCLSIYVSLWNALVCVMCMSTSTEKQAEVKATARLDGICVLDFCLLPLSSFPPSIQVFLAQDPMKWL